MKKYRNQDFDPLKDELDVKAVDQAGFGTLNIPDSGRMIADPYPIMGIIPDPTQPRKVLPSKIRSAWNGKPETIGGMLMNWHKQAEYEFEPISLRKILDGTHQIKELKAEDEKEIPAIALEFLAITSLAASIKQDGLLNPITIAESGDPRKLVAGERRYLAYHMLNMFFSQDGYDKIPAFQKKFSVWDQAAENGARRPLNAIGTARQLALLLMEVYKDVPGADFQPYHQLVVGENDQPYYAQVKNGYVYPIKKEYAQRIVDVTGLKSARMISAYRGLLTIPPEIWIQADEENWTEFGIRSYITEQNSPTESLPTGKLDQSEESLTTVRLNQAEETPSTKDIATLKQRYTAAYLRLTGNRVGKVWGVKDDGRIEILIHGQRFTSFITEDDIESQINQAAYNAFIGRSAPQPEPTSGIKRFMLTQGVKVATKQGDTLIIDKPAFGGNTFQCHTLSGSPKNIDFKDIASIIYEGDSEVSESSDDATTEAIDDTQPSTPPETPDEETTEVNIPDPEFIFAEFDDLLMPMWQLAQATNMQATVKVLEEMRGLTTDEILELAEAGTLKEILQANFDSIALMLQQARIQTGEIITHVENWAYGIEEEEAPHD